jgi:uncharacterized iron-regulated protein
MAFGVLAALSGCAGMPASGPGQDATRTPRGGLFVLGTGENQATPALEPVESGAFAAKAANADYILIGEGHTVACDHLAQARLLEALILAGRKPALGLEMVGVDRQATLDAYFGPGTADARPLPARLAALARDLDWPRTWGHPFELYAPVFKVALNGGARVFALNVPASVMSAYRKKGAQGLTEEERRLLPKQIIPPPEAQRTALGAEFDRHAEMMRAKMDAAAKKGKASAAPAPQNAQDDPRERFFRVQSIWDSKMAESAVATRKQGAGPLVILAGAGHVERGWGIAHRLRALDPSARVLLVAPCRSDLGAGALPDPEVADLFFFCPEEHKSRLGFSVEWRETSKQGQARVTGVMPGSAAGKAGLQPEDLILAAGGKPLTGLADLHAAAIKALRVEDDAPQAGQANEQASKRKLTLRVFRAGLELEINLLLSRAPVTRKAP